MLFYIKYYCSCLEKYVFRENNSVLIYLKAFFFSSIPSSNDRLDFIVYAPSWIAV